MKAHQNNISIINFKMKTETTKQTQNNHANFLRIHDNVKRCKALDLNERFILSNIISYLINDQEFFQTDARQAKELGLSPAQISKYTGRLKERELIEVKMEFIVNPNGGRPVPKRYITVKDIDKWIKGNTIPTVKPLAPKKKKDNYVDGSVTTSTSLADDSTSKVTEIKPIEVEPILPQDKVLPASIVNNNPSNEELIVSQPKKLSIEEICEQAKIRTEANRPPSKIVNRKIIDIQNVTKKNSCINI